MSGGAAAVIVAAGRGARLGGDVPKQFLDLAGRPVLAWSVAAFLAHPDVDDLVVVLAPDRAGDPPDWLAGARVVAGGEARADSVRRGLAAIRAETEVVLVHDGARPFVTGALITRVLEAARGGPAIPVLPVADTIKRVSPDGRVLGSLDRAGLAAAQTPQGFPREVLARVHGARDSESEATDDAWLCERMGIDVRTVAGDAANFKITTATDLARARWWAGRGEAGGANGRA